MSFARLLSKDAGVGEPDSGGDNVDSSPASSRAAGKHDAAARMVKAIHASDHQGFSGALEDWHELNGTTGPVASAKSEDATPDGAFGED